MLKIALTHNTGKTVKNLIKSLKHSGLFLV